MKKITLVNTNNRRIDFYIKENIIKIKVIVTNGDELVYVYHTDGSYEKLDSNFNRTQESFYCEYIIKEDEIEEFSNIKGSTIERALYWREKDKTSMLMKLF